MRSGFPSGTLAWEVSKDMSATNDTAGFKHGAVMAGAFTLYGGLLWSNWAFAIAAPPDALTPPVAAPAQVQAQAQAPQAMEDAAAAVLQAPSAERARTPPEHIRAAIAEAEKRRLARLEPDPGPSKQLIEQWGVEVIGINLTSAGYMLDFRFRVLDAEKALPLFDHRIKPYVLTERAKIKLPVPMAPKVGAFRPTNRGKNIKADKTYYMVFANPDSYLNKGEKVSVVIGDFRAENLTVQ